MIEVPNGKFSSSNGFLIDDHHPHDHITRSEFRILTLILEFKLMERTLGMGLFFRKLGIESLHVSIYYHHHARSCHIHF
jgi:hypothetical protein